VRAAGPVLVFDMDGVLFDTEAVKQRAFVDAFGPVCRDDAGLLDQVRDYNSANRGVPRDAKISHLLAVIPWAAPGDHDLVAGRYRDLLAVRLPDCPPVPGVSEFLSAVPATRYIASSAPEYEIRQNTARHGIDGAFAAIFGHPWTKAGALREISGRHQGAAVIFFGDAPADLAAAREAGTRFAAVNPSPALASQVPEFFGDFTVIDRQVIARLAGCAGTG